MLKRLAIVGLLLAIAPIMPGQPNKASDQKQESAKQGQPAALPTDSPNKQASAQTYQPEANPNPPEWYASLKRPDWWLVLAAFSTLGVICWQSIETRKAAQGAFLNAQALITAERPWLVANFTKSQEDTIPESGSLRFCWEVRNVGRTPAKLTFAAARVVFNLDAEPLPDVPDYGEPDYHFTQRVLVPGATLAFLAYWYERKDGKYRRLYQTEDVEALDLIVGFGCVRYRDTFNSGKEYVSCFSDTTYINGKRIPEPFSPWMDAPAEYTECT
jgi:hypothetical protein